MKLRKNQTHIPTRDSRKLIRGKDPFCLRTWRSVVAFRMFGDMYEGCRVETGGRSIMFKSERAR